jgi:P-loop containing NTP hydrolase pore-1
MSTNSDLHHDATRDLRDLGVHVSIINNVQTLDRELRAGGLPKHFQQGVLFMCDTTLNSTVKRCV